jgi:hypothetical protein
VLLVEKTGVPGENHQPFLVTDKLYPNIEHVGHVVYLIHKEQTVKELKFVSDLRQVGGFILFPPPIKTVRNDIT